MSTFEKLRSVELDELTKRLKEDPIFSVITDNNVSFMIRRESVFLKNGSKISIQGSETHYSTPRANLAHLTDYQRLELKVISGGETLDYSALNLDENFNWATDVIEYVPLADVISFIDLNGGLV